jgi:hypothetical protein
VQLAPIAVTQVNWPAYDTVCRDNLGYAPIKEIDGSKFQLSDPAAYLSTLNFDDPLRTLREGDPPSFAHYHVTFAGVLSEYDYIRLTSETQFTVTSKELKRNELFVLITGNAVEWRSFALKHCTKESDLRVLANVVYTRFKQAGFRELFDGYTVITLSDGTFVLK